MPTSATNEYSNELRVKLKRTTSGKRNEGGICDLRIGGAILEVGTDDGDAGGEAGERREDAFAGVGNLGGGVLTGFAAGVSLDMDCDFARRAIAAGFGRGGGACIWGRLKKMALVNTRNMGGETSIVCK